MSSQGKIVLVTGANQGLGFYIVLISALREPSYSYILCSRNIDNGKEAEEKMRRAGVTAKIDLLQLDVTNDRHIAAAINHVEKTYGRLDVLINNAGTTLRLPERDLQGIRQAYNEILNVNLTSVAVITTGFIPLLHKSTDPKVINISSGLGSIQNTLTKKMGRVPHYGTTKVALNGLSIHMQVAENDRVDAEAKTIPAGKPRIRFYMCAPGLLKTAFTGFLPFGKEPEAGAEVVVRLLADDEGTYEGGTYWEFEDGEMKKVPW